MSEHLVVKTPSSRFREREYAVDVLLRQFLGLAFEIRPSDLCHTEISCVDGAGVAVIPDGLLAMEPSKWLEASSLPEEPIRWVEPRTFLGRHHLPVTRIPVIYEPSPRFLSNPLAPSDYCLVLPVDLFGGTFFMLTRYEECVGNRRDRHDRFPASASVAFRQGFLGVPVVNQYAEVLWVALHRLWPRLRRRRRTYEMWVSHDVDSPFLAYRPGRARLMGVGLKRCAGDLAKRRSVLLAAQRAKAVVSTLTRGPAGDPHYNLDVVMDLDEAYGLRGTFFYMAGGKSAFGPTYTLEDREIRAILRRSASRGHDLGLHASYESAEDVGVLKREWLHLRAVAASEGIRQEQWGCRTHFLRWFAESGFRDADALGAGYDSTLGYADSAGFRCGSCYEFTTFDVMRGEPLALVERPLVAMEGSVIDSAYMGMGLGEEAFDVFRSLGDECKKYEGTYALLWHNSRLVSQAETELFKAVLGACCRR